MPLVGLTSFTLVVVPVVDLPFRYAEFFVTLSGIFFHTFTNVNLGMRDTCTRIFKAYVRNTLSSLKSNEEINEGFLCVRDW